MYSIELCNVIRDISKGGVYSRGLILVICFVSIMGPKFVSFSKKYIGSGIVVAFWKCTIGGWVLEEKCKFPSGRIFSDCHPRRIIRATSSVR